MGGMKYLGYLGSLSGPLASSLEGNSPRAWVGAGERMDLQANSPRRRPSVSDSQSVPRLRPRRFSWAVAVGGVFARECLAGSDPGTRKARGFTHGN